jgi:hypothetical protein
MDQVPMFRPIAFPIGAARVVIDWEACLSSAGGGVGLRAPGMARIHVRAHRYGEEPEFSVMRT